MHDSFMKHIGFFDRQSKIVKPRNPFAQDEALDYEMDSEDEWNEQNGEDLDKNEEDEDDEEEKMSQDEQEELQKMFVPDDCFSDSEMDLSGSQQS